MLEAVQALIDAHPTPEGGDAGFWEILRVQAAMGSGLSELCLSHGHISVSQPSVPCAFRGAKKQCFQNAGRLALTDESFTYVEGLASTRTLGMPLHHAWLLNSEGKVVDPTWKNGRDYCGLAFSLNALKEIIGATETWGVFDNARTPAWVATDLLRWMHPRFTRNLPEAHPDPQKPRSKKVSR